MKGLLAVSVLCLTWLGRGSAAFAQTPAPPAEVAEPAPPAPVISDPSAVAPPAAPPPTPVDTSPPTPVHTPPVAAPSVQVAPLAQPPLPEAPRPPAKLLAPRLRDAHHDRLFIAPTAETNPRGSFYVTSYEILIWQAGYSLTDSTQLSVTATPPLSDEDVVPGDISLKTVILRERAVSVAAIASASGIIGFEEFSGFLGRAGGVVTLCADPDECRLSFSVASNVALAGPASLWFNAAGVNFRAHRLLSLIAEVDSLLPLSEPVGEANGLLGIVGVRLSGRAWGVDLAAMSGGKATTGVGPVVPFVAATYRYVP